jgi:hypothetical protein
MKYAFLDQMNTWQRERILTCAAWVDANAALVGVRHDDGMWIGRPANFVVAGCRYGTVSTPEGEGIGSFATFLGDGKEYTITTLSDVKRNHPLYYLGQVFMLDELLNMGALRPPIIVDLGAGAYPRYDMDAHNAKETA